MPHPLTIKWGKEKIEIADIGAFKTSSELKQHIAALTGVSPQRQTITGIGKGVLKDDVILDPNAIEIKKVARMMGSADKVPEKPREETLFIEDMVVNEEDAFMVKYPPGLTNLGNTCYMNSVVQTLRAVPEFKSALYNYKGHFHSNSITEKITASLRDLYKSMDHIQNGEEVTPQQFVSAFRAAFPLFNSSEQTPFGPMYTQQDAEEFFNTLRNATVSELKNVDPSIPELFVGHMAVTYTNQETEEPPVTTVEDFHSLKCFIKKETRHVLEGLKDGMSGTVERHSDKLGRNANYSKEARISELPQYLMVNYVRFFWKQKEKVQNKIIKKVKFPIKLDVASLCTPELQEQIQATRKAILLREEEESNRRREEMTKEARELIEKEEAERAKRRGEAPKSTTTTTTSASKKDEDKMDTSDDSKPAGDINGPNADYELVALVTHKGREISSGHYIGWVKEEGSGRWLKFDDEKVNEVEEKQVLELSGGGDFDCTYISIYSKIRGGKGKVTEKEEKSE